MALNRDLVGKVYPKSDPVEVTAEEGKAYALATNDENPRYLAGEFVPPMLGVRLGWSGMGAPVADSDLNVDFMRLVHGEQHMRFNRPIKPGDTIHCDAKILSIGAWRSTSNETNLGKRRLITNK